MIKSSYPRSFLLTIVFLIFLLSITMINGNNNHHHHHQMEENLFEKRFTSKNSFNDLLKQADINKENIEIFIRDLQQQYQQAYPDRRSSFHALRGKRRAE
jgi:hypothetical protein